MEPMDNTLFSVTVLPVSNVKILRGSVLPERFVSDSRSQPSAIVGDDLGSSVRVIHEVCEVVAPVAIR